MKSITRGDIMDKQPCEEAVDWLTEHPAETIQELWAMCERGDWMLRALRNFYPLDSFIAAPIACAIIRETPVGEGRTIWDLLTDPRSRQAVIVTEQWLAGDATLDQVRTAAHAAADAAYAADICNLSYIASAAYATYAAYAAVDIVDGADYAVGHFLDVTKYVSDAVDAVDAGDDYMAYESIANIVRRFVPAIEV